MEHGLNRRAPRKGPALPHPDEHGPVQLGVLGADSKVFVEGRLCRCDFGADKAAGAMPEVHDRGQ